MCWNPPSVQLGRGHVRRESALVSHGCLPLSVRAVVNHLTVFFADRRTPVRGRSVYDSFRLSATCHHERSVAKGLSVQEWSKLCFVERSVSVGRRPRGLAPSAFGSAQWQDLGSENADGGLAILFVHLVGGLDPASGQ